MEKHQDRVIEEKRGLDIKINKLSAFMGSDTHDSLEGAERVRLHKQFEAMQAYSNCLNERINCFPKEVKP